MIRWPLGKPVNPAAPRFRIGWHIPVKPGDFDRMPASVWIRCLQLLPYLREAGVSCTVNKPRKAADIAVFVRWQDSSALQLARKLKERGQRIVLDLCVNYFDNTGMFDGGYGTTERHVEECLRMTEVADLVVCGSEFIRRRAENHHPRAVYLPESIDGRHFSFTKEVPDFDKPALTAVWSGQPAKTAELAELYPLLAKRDIALLIISERKPPMPGPCGYLPWSYHTFPEAIVRGDFCLSPRVTDNSYDLGHSHFKIGVFMAEGVPALASPLPSYEEVIGKTGGGRICRTTEEWEAALDAVLADRTLLSRWSEAARSGMEEYGTDRISLRYRRFFEKLLGS